MDSTVDSGRADTPPWVQFEELLDHLTTALLVVDNGIVVYANTSAANITGRKTADELQGAPLQSVFPLESYPQIHEACEQVCHRETPAVHLTGIVCHFGQQQSYIDVHVARLHVGSRCAVVLLLYDLSQLTCALRRSQEAERRLADLISTLPGVVWEYDRRRGVFTLISDYARVLTGHQTERFLQHPEFFFQQIHPDDLAAFQPLWEQLKRTHQPGTWRFRLRSEEYPDGWRWLQAEIVPVLDEAGELVAVRGVSYDIHREVETQRLLERRTKQLEALIHFSSRFVEVRTEEEVVRVLRELMRQTLDFEYIAVYLRRQNGVVEKAQVVGDSVVWEGMELDLKEGITRLRDVLLGRIPYFVSRDALRDVSQIERELWVQLLGSAERVFSNAVVPIRGRTQVLGALAVDRRDTGEPITESELSMLLTIGRYTGLALDNVKLMQELRVAEERLRHLVQNLPVTVWELNLATRQLEFISEYVEEWLGYTPAEWQANPTLYYSVVHPDDIELFQRVINPDVSSVPQPVEIRLRDKQGRWHWCRILWTLTYEEERAPLVRGVTTDITAQKQAEQQQLHLMRLRSLGEIASGVAHNFNNLLMGILGNAELLQSALQYDPELQRRAEIIAQLAHDASAIVQRMQGFYKLQTPTRREQVRLQPLLEDVIDSTRPVWYGLAGRRGAEIRVNLIVEADPVVEASRSELLEVFTNLIINACDAMPHGGVITLSLRERDGLAVIDVADTGTGMTPEVRERCFDAFFTTKGERGSGLGLSVSYQIIARHSGQITVRSEVGRGTVFTVQLPVVKEGGALRQASAQPLHSTTLRILTVDDDEAVRTAIQHLLEADGHQVTAASDADVALVEFQQQHYDLVILDLGMPQLDGLSLARQIKQRAPSVPVILLTGWGDQLREDKPHEVDMVLAKPVRRATLRAALAQLVRQREA
ncbi:MAG: PAS domain-containing protein [Armatimonadota bacterium]|nr:PAS domain-containing protein [bacterium]MDW8320264.1 PAS domain-containing protein [Armatimonadota bacterium]